MANNALLDDEEKTELNGSADETLQTARETANNAVAKQTATPAESVPAPAPKPTYTTDEIIGHIRNGTDYTMDEINAMSDSEYANYSKVVDDYRKANPTPEMNAKMLHDRMELSDALEKKAAFVAEHTDGDDDFKKEHDSMAYSADWLKNHKTTFAQMSDEDVAAVSADIEKKYKEAADRRGHLEVAWDALKKGYWSTGNMIYQGATMLKPGALDQEDRDNIAGSMKTNEDLEIENPQKISGVEGIHSVGDALDWFSETVGENLTRGAVATGAAAVGAMAAPAIGVSAGIGAILTGSLGTMALNTGEAVQDQLKEGRTDDITKTRGWALAQGAGYSILDGAFGVSAWGAKLWAGALRKAGAKTLAESIARPEVAKWAARNTAMSTVKGATKEVALHGVLGEGIQEAAQSQIVGRGIRYFQEGTPFKKDESVGDAFLEAVNEFAGGAAAGLTFGLLGGGASHVNAKRTVDTMNKIDFALKDDKAYQQLGTYEKLLVKRHLINDAYLETTNLIQPEIKASLAKCNKDIDNEIRRLSELKGEKHDLERLAGQSARLYLDLFKSNHALEEIGDVIKDFNPQTGEFACNDGNTYKSTLDLDGMKRSARLATDKVGNKAIVYTNPIKGSEISVMEFLGPDGKPNGRYSFNNDESRKMPLFSLERDKDGNPTNGLVCKDLNEALQKAQQIDIFNQWREKRMESKAKVATQVFEHLFGGRGVSLRFVDKPSDGTASVATTTAAYNHKNNTVEINLDNINNIGSLYTNLVHERCHEDIVEFLLKSGKFYKYKDGVRSIDWDAFDKDREEMFANVSDRSIASIEQLKSRLAGSGAFNKKGADGQLTYDENKINQVAAELWPQVKRNGLTAEMLSSLYRKPGAKADEKGNYSEGQRTAKWGESAGYAGEEMTAERTSIIDLAKQLRNADRGIIGGILDKVRSAIGMKMALDMGLDPRAIRDDDVATEMDKIFEIGYLGEPAEAGFKRENSTEYRSPMKGQSEDEFLAQHGYAKAGPTVSGNDEVNMGTENMAADEEKPTAAPTVKHLKPQMANGDGASLANHTNIVRADGAKFTKFEKENGSYVWTNLDTNEDVDDATATEGGYDVIHTDTQAAQSAEANVETAPTEAKAEEAPKPAAETTAATETKNEPSEAPSAPEAVSAPSEAKVETQVAEAPKVESPKTEESAKPVAAEPVKTEPTPNSDEKPAKVDKAKPAEPEPVKANPDETVTIPQNKATPVKVDAKAETVTVPAKADKPTKFTPEQKKKLVKETGLSSKYYSPETQERWLRLDELPDGTTIKAGGGKFTKVGKIAGKAESTWKDANGKTHIQSTIAHIGDFNVVDASEVKAEEPKAAEKPPEAKPKKAEKKEKPKAEKPKAEPATEQKPIEKPKAEEKPAAPVSVDEKKDEANIKFEAIDKEIDTSIDTLAPDATDAQRKAIRDMARKGTEIANIKPNKLVPGIVGVFGASNSDIPIAMFDKDGNGVSKSDLISIIKKRNKTDDRHFAERFVNVLSMPQVSDLSGLSLFTRSVGDIPSKLQGLSSNRLLAMNAQRKDPFALAMLWRRWAKGTESPVQKWFAKKGVEKSDMDEWLRKTWIAVVRAVESSNALERRKANALAKHKYLERLLKKASSNSERNFYIWVADGGLERGLSNRLLELHLDHPDWSESEIDKDPMVSSYRNAIAKFAPVLRRLNMPGDATTEVSTVNTFADSMRSIVRGERNDSLDDAIRSTILFYTGAGQKVGFSNQVGTRWLASDKPGPIVTHPYPMYVKTYSSEELPLDSRLSPEQQAEVREIEKKINDRKTYLRGKNYLDSAIEKDPLVVSQNEKLKQLTSSVSHYAVTRDAEIDRAVKDWMEHPDKVAHKPLLGNIVNDEAFFYSILNAVWQEQEEKDAADEQSAMRRREIEKAREMQKKRAYEQSVDDEIHASFTGKSVEEIRKERAIASSQTIPDEYRKMDKADLYRKCVPNDGRRADPFARQQVLVDVHDIITNGIVKKAIATEKVPMSAFGDVYDETLRTVADEWENDSGDNHLWNNSGNVDGNTLQAHVLTIARRIIGRIKNEHVKGRGKVSVVANASNAAIENTASDSLERDFASLYGNDDDVSGGKTVSDERGRDAYTNLPNRNGTFPNAFKAIKYIRESGRLSAFQNGLVRAIINAWDGRVFAAKAELEKAQAKVGIHGRTLNALAEKLRKSYAEPFTNDEVLETAARELGMKPLVFKARLGQMLDDIERMFLGDKLASKERNAPETLTAREKDILREYQSGRFTAEEVDDVMAGFEDRELLGLKAAMKYNGDEVMARCVELAELGKKDSEIGRSFGNGEWANLPNRDGSGTVKTILDHAANDYGWVDKRTYDAAHRRAIVVRAVEELKGGQNISTMSEEDKSFLTKLVDSWIGIEGVKMSRDDLGKAILFAYEHEIGLETKARRAAESKAKRLSDYELFESVLPSDQDTDAAKAKLREHGYKEDEIPEIFKHWESVDMENARKDRAERQKELAKKDEGPKTAVEEPVKKTNEQLATPETKREILKAEIAKTGKDFATDEEIVDYAVNVLGMTPLTANVILRQNRPAEIAEMTDEELSRRAADMGAKMAHEGEVDETPASSEQPTDIPVTWEVKREHGAPTKRDEEYANEVREIAKEIRKRGIEPDGIMVRDELVKKAKKRMLSDKRANELAIEKLHSYKVVTGQAKKDTDSHYHERIITPEMDAAYADAVKRGDKETALRMIREAAAKAMPNTKVVDKDGLPKVMWHGSKDALDGTFTVFEEGHGPGVGFWFTPNREYAAKHGPLLKGGTNERAFFLNAKKGISEEEAFDNYDLMHYPEQNVVSKMVADGYDHVEYNATGKGHIVVFYPSQIKSADITYDDAGNLIPLSERFNPSNDDIRYHERMDVPDPDALYSAKESQVHHGVIGENFKSRAHKRNEKLREEAETLRKNDGLRQAIEQGRSGKILTDVQVVALLLDQADRLKQSMDGSLDADVEEANQRWIRDEAEALRYGLSEAAAALAAAKFGVDLRTMDTVAYIRSQLKAKMEREIEKAHGSTEVAAHAAEIEKELTKKDARIGEMAAEMQKLHDKIDEQKKVIAEKDSKADEKTVNRIADEAYRKGVEEGVAKGERKATEAEARRRAESIERAIKEFGFDEKYAEATIDALDELGDVFGVEKRFAGNPKTELTDRARKLFAIVLRGAGNDEAKARAAIEAKYGGTVSEMFDKFVAEENSKAVSPDGSMEGKKKARRRNVKKMADEAEAEAKSDEVDVSEVVQPETPEAPKRKIRVKNAKGRSYIEKLKNKTADAALSAKDAADEALRLQYIGEYARNYFKLLKIVKPDAEGVSLLGELAKRMSGVIPGATFDENDAKDALLMRGDFPKISREKARATYEQLKKAAEFLTKNPTKVAEAAAMAGIEYVSDAELLQKLDHELGRQVDKMLNRYESRVNEEDNRELGEELHKYIMALHDIRSGKPTKELLAKYLGLSAGLKDYRRQRSVLERIQSRIEMYERKLANNDFEPTPKRENPDTLKELKAIRHAEMDLERLRQRFKHERDMWNIKKGPWLSRQISSIGEILGEIKAIAGSFDLSSVLRQGGQMTWAHPLLAIRNMKQTLSILRSDERANDAYDSIFDRPNAKYYQLAGIDFTLWGDNSPNAEDLFLLNKYRAITRMKLLRLGVECSERAFSMYLNLMRADTFDAMVRNSPFRDASNMTVEQLKALGNYINVASQRGMIDQSGNMGKALKFLNTVFWSPRNIISRFNFIWETAKLALPGANPYGATDAKMRGMIAREIARYLTGVGIAIAFAKMLADLFRDDDEPPEKMVFDPRSSQFLEVKVGNTHLDFLSGLKQMIVFGSRMFSGKTVNARGQVQDANRLEKIGSFLRSKFAPASSIVYDTVITRENYEKQDILWTEPFANGKDEIGIARYTFGQITPLSINDVAEHFALNNGIGRPFGTALLAMLGLGANTYDSNTYKQLKGDFQYYRKLWGEMDSPEERQKLEARHPVFKKNEGAIVAWIRETERVRREIRKIEKARDKMKNPDKQTLARIEDSLKTLREAYERNQKIALNHMVGIKNPTAVD